MNRYVLSQGILLLLVFAMLLGSFPGYAKTSMGSFSPEQSIQHAKVWVEKQVPYDQKRTYEKYRTDCSGFVSMAWGLPAPGLNTWGLEKISTEIKKDELKPGDILLNNASDTDAHVVLFGGWANKEHTAYHAYEENGFYGLTREELSMPYPYYSGYATDQYIPRRYDPAKIKNPEKIVSIKPRGIWDSPQEGDTIGDIVHFSAHAYPTNPSDPKISSVNFTIRSNNSWFIACTATRPASGDLYSCDADLKKLGIVYGKIKVSFDVMDEKGNSNLAPHGVRNVTHSPSPVPAPTKKPDFSRFVGLWKMYGTAMKINSDGSAVYEGRTYVNCDSNPQPCDDYSGAHGGSLAGLNTQIQFTRIDGNTAYGTITGGTGDRDKNNTIIPVGGNITVTLTSQGKLIVSDGKDFIRCTPDSQDMQCISNT